MADRDGDIIIIGSGPAGVSAALPLVKAGLRVVMVDGGRMPTDKPPAGDFLSLRQRDTSQWRWMVGEDYAALQAYSATSPKFRVPNISYVFADHHPLNRIKTNRFLAVGSLATGGLSNAWGCSVTRFCGHDLKEYPLDSSDLDPSYQSVAQRIGISGKSDDDLESFFGLDRWAQPAIALDTIQQSLLTRYLKKRPDLNEKGFLLGRTRLAVLTEKKEGREACDRAGLCLWGCARGATYSASYDLMALHRYPNFTHRSGVIIDGLEREEGGWCAKGKAIQEGQPCKINGSFIVLAAGTLATTAILMRSLLGFREARLLTTPAAGFALWLPTLLGSVTRADFSLAQLSFILNLNGDQRLFGSLYSPAGIPVHELVRHAPFARRYAIDLFRGLMSSMLLANCFFPGSFSQNTVHLNHQGELEVNGGYADHFDGTFKEVETRIRCAFRKMGALLIPGSFTRAENGADVHYAGTVPMKQNPGLGQSDRNGEVFRMPGVFVADGASLSALPGKSHTLTIMANADRIANVQIKERRFFKVDKEKR